MFKKIYLGFLLLSINAIAQDNWVFIVKNSGGSLYYDPSSIKASGKILKLWTLQDLISPAPSGYLSAKLQLELDCQNESFKNLYAHTLTGHMGTGEPIFVGADPSNKSMPIAPDSTYKSLLDLVCKK